MLSELFSAAQFAPHGYCLAWRPDLVALHLTSDILIALAYFSIPAAIYYYLHRRPDFGYIGIAHAFAAFIICCGATHVFGALTLWYPIYEAEGLMKLLTAAVSLATAILLWPLVPRLLRIPAPEELQRANEALRREIVDREKAEQELLRIRADLEERVAERTAALQTLARQHQEARQEAEEASAFKTAFLRNVSHELRTPMNAILGFSEVMATQAFGPLGAPRYAEYAGDIHRSGLHLLELLNDLLDLERVAAGKRELNLAPVDVGKVIGDAWQMVQLKARDNGIEVDTVLPSSAAAWADATALRQVLINLLDNAVKYTPRGGRISVAARNSSDGVEIEIQDNGIGISDEDMKRLGTPFARAGDSMVRQQQGYGLGLALCFGLVKQMGGDLIFRSKLGRGTTAQLHMRAVARGTLAVEC